MFGFFKKKGNDPESSGKSGGNPRVGPVQPQTPWAQAMGLKEQGRAAEALDLFARTAIQTRDLSRMDIAELWLADQTMLDQAGEAAVCRFVAILTQLLDPVEPVRRQRLWEGCLNALRNVKDPVPRQDTTDRYTAECILLRHMGRNQEALEVVREGVRLHGTASNLTFAGLCCLNKGDPEQAEEYVRRGLELDPDNLAPCNDLADYFLQCRDYPKAIEYYAMAARGDRADREWAEPSLFFCRWMETADPVELERLALLAACQPQNQRSAEMCGAARQEKKLSRKQSPAQTHPGAQKEKKAPCQDLDSN